MWEVLLRAPRGSYNPRKLSMLLATFLVACFGYLLASSPLVHAADSSWDGDNLVYNGSTYTPVSDTSKLPNDLKKSVVYQYIDASTTPTSVYFIYFPTSAGDPKSAKEATYIKYTLNPPNNYSNPTDKQTIVITPASADASTSDGTLGHECTINGIGWIICPVMNGVSEGMDFIYARIQAFLEVHPLTTSTDNPIYRVWMYSRDLANILFIIGFIVIIYSYLVGGGFSGYEIRKILPRLVVAAILINVSYILCAGAVDLSNISGYAIDSLFENVRDSVLAGSSTADGVNWTSVTTWVLAGGVGTVAGGIVLTSVVGGAAAGLWFLLAPFLLGAALLVIVTFLILAARQAVIVIAIVIAPLAFAANILPNTEKWFEKWRDMFVTMLVMFPAFGAVFGGAQLAGELIIRTATTIEQLILGLGVMVAPLAITPLLLRLGGGVLNRFGGIVNDKTKGAYDRYKNYNQERLADFRARQDRMNARRDSNGNLLLGRNQFLRRSAYRQNYKKYNRQRLRDANTASANAMYEDNDQGLETFRSRVGRRYANARGQQYDPSFKYGSGEISGLEHRTELLKGSTHARHDEHWQHELQHTPGLRGMLTDTRMAEGRAKVMSGSMEAQDERALRTALHQAATPEYAHLRQMQVQSVVDSSYADAMKGRLDTEGKLAFKQEFSGANDAARALRRAFNETKAMEKEVSVIDTVLEKRADAHWDRTTQTDDRLRNLRLQAVEATDSASKYEEQWNKLIANIRAEGASAPGITLNADKTTAGRIKQLGMDIQYEKFAQDAAQRVSQQNMSQTLKTNDAIRAYAGGIGREAASNRIYAKARKDIVGAYLEDVENSRSVLSEYSLVELMRLHQEGLSREKDANGNFIDVKDNHAMRDAAMREIVLTKGNNWAFQKTKDFVAGLGMNYDEKTNQYYELIRDADGFVQKDADGKPLQGAVITDPDEIDRRRDIEQLFVDSAKNSKLKIANFSGTDRGNAETGTFYLDSKETIIRDIRDKKINASRLAGTDVDELQRMIQVLRQDSIRGRLTKTARSSLIKTIEFALTDPQTRAQIGDREADLMQVISNYVGDERATIPAADKKAYESYSNTKAPYKYQHDRVSDFGDGFGPDGTM